MADDEVRRRRQAMERIANFVDNELRNGRRPDCPEWKKQRVKTIKTLNDLREKLDNVCVRANCGKAVGNGAEILGAAAAILGGILSLFGKPSGPVITNIGNMTRSGGTLTEELSNVVESLFTAKYLSDIEKVLKRDQELSLPLAEWLDFSNELDANVQEIFGVSLASEKFHMVTKVFYEFSQLSNSATSFDVAMSLMRKGRYSVYIGTDVKIETLQKFFQQLSAFPELADRLRKTLSVLSLSLGAIQVFISGVRVCRYLKGISSSFVVPSLAGGPNPGIPTAREFSVFSFFQAINLAQGVISLMNSVRIIKHGTSKYSDAIKSLTHSLDSELRQMENL